MVRPKCTNCSRQCSRQVAVLASQIEPAGNRKNRPSIMYRTKVLSYPTHKGLKKKQMQRPSDSHVRSPSIQHSTCKIESPSASSNEAPLQMKILHPDNLPAHSVRLTQETLRELCVSMLLHLSYTPDLATCDF